ncbi:hypothetical protein KDL45_14545, partial [bacterium]|nr:hypothetical protein [bacterium]
RMTGVWPRGFYLMFAGIGTDAPTHMIVTETPAPGQIVDLGDVVLNDAGVITGTVLDDKGQPMSGALVRAADIPGALAAFFPIERFDPDGAVLVRERSSPVNVVEIPAWVKPAFENLPIPTARSASDGTFRLVGVMPGSNMLAITQKQFLPHVKPSVQVRAGAVRDVGKVRMRRGEELYAQVVDEKGEPVAGAEVLAGSTLTMAPVDLAQRLGQTNAEGIVEGTGFSPGKVTVAARRSANDPWVVAEPQNIISDVVVTLPATFSVTVSVRTAEGPVEQTPEFKLLRGEKGDGAAGDWAAYAGFDDFMDMITSASVTVGDKVRYDSPSVGLVEVGDEGPMTVKDAPVDIGPYDRMDDKYAASEWGSGVATIAFDGRRLELDFNAATRTYLEKTR